jgi:hypothetical protein
MARLLRQELGVQCAEETFNLAAALRPRNGGIHELKMQIDRYLLKVLTGKVAAMIDVKHVRNGTHGPARIGFTPDGLSQSERGPQGRRSAEKDQGSRR